MIRSLRHRQILQYMLNRNSVPLCRCLCKDNDGKVTTSGESGVNIADRNDLDTDSGSKRPSLSSKLAKPIGRLQHEKDPRYRMPGLTLGEEEESELSQNLDDRLRIVARMVAKSMSSDSKEIKRTESELEFMLKSTAIERESAKEGEPVQIDMRKVLEGFGIEKRIPKSELKPGRFLKKKEVEWKPYEDADDSDYGRYPMKGSITEEIMAQERQEPSEEGKRRPWGRRGSVTGSLFRQQTQASDGHRSRPRAPPTGLSSRKFPPIYSDEVYGVFTEPPRAKNEPPVPPLLPTWERLTKDELEMALIKPPTNAFEEMILWTKQGKLWKYPIDNEQGIESEKNVPFYEHVFLEHLIANEKFPSKGPIRQFMQVMVLALQKNPYISIERKKQTIEWFGTYFEQKETLAKRVGAM